MAGNGSSPFTNTRLMVAGLVVGMIGMFMTFAYTNRAIKEKIGDQVEVYYVTRDVLAGEQMELSFVSRGKVQRDLANEANQMIIRDPAPGGADKMIPLIGKAPNRNLSKGDILLASMFSETSSDVRTQPPRGKAVALLDVASSPNIGETLRKNDLVNVSGSLIFQDGDRKANQQITLLRAVRVVSINGREDPDFRAQRVSSIGVMVSEETAAMVPEILRQHLAGGSVTLSLLNRDSPESRPNEEIPQDTMALMKKHGIIR